MSLCSENSNVKCEKARVGVVFDVFAVDEMLQMVERRVRTVLELEHAHLKHVDLLGRMTLIEYLRPQFRLHLQLHVLEVALARYLLVHVGFGHVVARSRPVILVNHIGQFLSI
jgi:hypothetical protein